MKAKDLSSNHYIFGNKGSLWSNAAHIAKNSSSTTLCGTPMLSFNHCKDVEDIGCKKCLQIYTENK